MKGIEKTATCRRMELEGEGDHGHVIAAGCVLLQQDWRDEGCAPQDQKINRFTT